MTKVLRSYNATGTPRIPVGAAIVEKAPADWAHSKSWRDDHAPFLTTECQETLDVVSYIPRSGTGALPIQNVQKIRVEHFGAA